MQDQPLQQPAPFQDDEIDLFELWNGLVQEKWTIVSVVLISLVLSVAYLMLGSKTYQVEASYSPPFSKQVETLKYPNLVNFTPGQVYSKFMANITSTKLAYSLTSQPELNQVFSNDEVSIQSKINAFENSIHVTLPQTAKGKEVPHQNIEVLLDVEWSSPEGAFEIANAALELAQLQTKSEIKDDVISVLNEKKHQVTKAFELEDKRVSKEIQSEITRLLENDLEKKMSLTKQIDLLREKAENVKKFRISRLESDLKLAKDLKITYPINPLDYQSNMPKNTVVDITNTLPSRYWLGTEILSKEIDTLKNRENNDPYIPELPALLEEIKSLETNTTIETLQARENNEPFSDKLRNYKQQLVEIGQAMEKVKIAEFEVVRLMKVPVLPEDPIKPNKKLIVAVALVLGGMLGVFIALIRSAIKKRRDQAVV